MFKAIILALACACAPKIQHGVEADNSNGESSVALTSSQLKNVFSTFIWIKCRSFTAKWR